MRNAMANRENYYQKIRTQLTVNFRGAEDQCYVNYIRHEFAEENYLEVLDRLSMWHEFGPGKKLISNEQFKIIIDEIFFKSADGEFDNFIEKFVDEVKQEIASEIAPSSSINGLSERSCDFSESSLLASAQGVNDSVNSLLVKQAWQNLAATCVNVLISEVKKAESSTSQKTLVDCFDRGRAATRIAQFVNAIDDGASPDDFPWLLTKLELTQLVRLISVLNLGLDALQSVIDYLKPARCWQQVKDFFSKQTIRNCWQFKNALLNIFDVINVAQTADRLMTAEAESLVILPCLCHAISYYARMPDVHDCDIPNQIKQFLQHLANRYAVPYILNSDRFAIHFRQPAYCQSKRRVELYGKQREVLRSILEKLVESASENDTSELDVKRSHFQLSIVTDATEKIVFDEDIKLRLAHIIDYYAQGEQSSACWRFFGYGADVAPLLDPEVAKNLCARLGVEAKSVRRSYKNSAQEPLLGTSTTYESFADSKLPRRRGVDSRSLT